MLPHIHLTPPIQVYPATNVRKKFATAKFWQILKLSHPIVMGGEAETMFNQVTFILFFYRYIITRTFKQHKKHYHQVHYIEST